MLLLSFRASRPSCRPWSRSLGLSPVLSRPAFRVTHMSSRIPLLRSLAYSLVSSRTVLPPSRSPFPVPRRSHTLSALPFRVVWLSVRSLSPVPAAHSPPRSPGCLSSPALSIFISADAPPGCPCRLHGFFPPGCFSAPDSFPPVCLPAGSSLRKASALPPSLLTCPLRVARIFSRLSAGRLSCCSLPRSALGRLPTDSVAHVPL